MHEKYEAMVERYPKLYKQREFIACGPGWYKLLDDLSSKLEVLITAQNVDPEYECCAVDVKEKYGTLRFYMDGTTDEMDELIHQAEMLSGRTCECCGEPGKLYDHGWCYTRCEDCWQKNL